MTNDPYILIVDDEPANFFLLTETLQGLLDVKTAQNGEQALKMANEHPPEIVLLDVAMPLMDGYEVCRRLKADTKLCEIPVIFLSAVDSVSDKLKGFDAGGVDYITKPFSTREVYARVSNHLALQNVKKELQDKNTQLKEEILTRQEAEHRLKESEEKYRLLFEKTNDAIFIINLDFTIAEANNKASELFGTSIDNIVNRPMTDFVLLEQSEEAIHRGKRILSGETLPTYEQFFQLRNGRGFPAEITATLIEDANGNPLYIHSLIRDISERKQLQEALAESEKRYRGIVQNASEAVFSTDDSGIFTYVNPVMARRSGYSETELTGQHYTSLVDDDWKETVTRFYQKQAFLNIHETVLAFPLKTANKSNDPVWVEQTVNLIKEGSDIKGFLGIARDITERKKNEEERELLIAELDAFAHTVAHDLKTPLSSMKLSSYMIGKAFRNLSADKQRMINTIQSGVDQMVDIIDALLLLSTVRKQGTVPSEALDMATIVSGAITRLEHQFELYNASYTVADDFPVAIGYAPWINEVWVNYLTNALKYGGTPPQVKIGADSPANGFVRYWVQDNGAGLSQEEQNQVFTPFTRLSQINIEGHGLGLSIVQRIVGKLGGEVGVESQIGQGSLFYFTLPQKP